MLARRLVVPLLLFAAAAAPATADAAKFQPLLGESDGLSIVVGRNQIQQIRFAPKAARLYRERFAGRRAVVRCDHFTDDPDDGFEIDGESSHSPLRLPARRRPILLGSPQDTGYGDVCRIRVGRRLVAILPGSEAGRAYLDELTTFGLLTFASLIATPDADQAENDPGLVQQAVDRGRGRIVALDGPDATPPPGKAGLWSDGTRGVTAATTTSGKRLYVSATGEDVTTNVLGYLSDQALVDRALALYVSSDPALAGRRRTTSHSDVPNTTR